MTLGILALALTACGDDTSSNDSSSATDSGTTIPDATSLADPTQGDPGLTSLQNLAFAPDGTLAIGDGSGEQIVALELPPGQTTDYRPAIDDIYQLVAEAFGDAQGTEANIWDIDADPRTGRIYLAAERLSTGEAALFRVMDDDTVEVVDLSDVTYSAVAYPSTGGAGSLIMALEWGSEQLTAAVTESNWSTNQVVSVAVPVSHEDTSTVTSTYTYHRTHNAWETRAPVVSLAAYTSEDVDYVAATYTCTPAVRFTQAALAAGESETVGETPFDYGGGKQVMDMVINSEGVYATIDGMLGNNTNPWDNFGVVRVNLDRMTQSTELDESAMQIVGVGDKINHPDASRFEALDGAYRLALVDDTHIVALQQAGLHVVDLTEE